MTDDLPEITEAELLAELDKLMVRTPKQYMTPLLYNLVKHARESGGYHFTWGKLTDFLTEKGLWDMGVDALQLRYKREKEQRGD